MITGVVVDGAERRNRTTDTRIFSPLLYRLSYLGFPFGGGIMPQKDVVCQPLNFVMPSIFSRG